MSEAPRNLESMVSSPRRNAIASAAITSVVCLAVCLDDSDHSMGYKLSSSALLIGQFAFSTYYSTIIAKRIMNYFLNNLNRS